MAPAPAPAPPPPPPTTTTTKLHFVINLHNASNKFECFITKGQEGLLGTKL